MLLLVKNMAHLRYKQNVLFLNAHASFGWRGGIIDKKHARRSKTN